MLLVAGFLAEWDSAIRALNFGELLLSVLALILIRNRSAKTNSPTSEATFIPLDFTTARTQAFSSPYRRHRATHVSLENADEKETTPDDIGQLAEGLKRLRETLRLISFHHPVVHFKTDLKRDAVWVRAMTSDSGIQRTRHTAKAKLTILRSAARMEPSRFRAELEEWLKERGFFERE